MYFSFPYFSSITELRLMHRGWAFSFSANIVPNQTYLTFKVYIHEFIAVKPQDQLLQVSVVGSR